MSAQAVRTWLRSRTRRLNSITAQATRAATRRAGSRMDVVTRAVRFAEDADDTAWRPARPAARSLRTWLPSQRLAAEAAPTGSDALPSAAGNLDPYVAHLDQLPRADLAGLAQLDRAAHTHRAAGHQRLAGAAAVAQAGELEQLVEFDVVALELEIDRLHRRQSTRRRCPGAAAGRAGQIPAGSPLADHLPCRTPCRARVAAWRVQGRDPFLQERRRQPRVRDLPAAPGLGVDVPDHPNPAPRNPHEPPFPAVRSPPGLHRHRFGAATGPAVAASTAAGAGAADADAAAAGAAGQAERRHEPRRAAGH